MKTEKEIIIRKLDEAPAFVSTAYKRVTSSLINCKVRIVSRKHLYLPSETESIFNIKCNDYEKEVAHFYHLNGYKSIRLEHFTTSSLTNKNLQSLQVRTLAKDLQTNFSMEFYNLFSFTSRSVKRALHLGEVSPKQYPLHCYPPDFLMVNHELPTWRFVEVKSPKDKLHFMQANWFVNLKPDDWEYEIFATLNKEFDESYLIDLSDVDKHGVKFDDAYQKNK